VGVGLFQVRQALIRALWGRSAAMLLGDRFGAAAGGPAFGRAYFGVRRGDRQTYRAGPRRCHHTHRDALEGAGSAAMHGPHRHPPSQLNDALVINRLVSILANRADRQSPYYALQ
jgi:hypothetical protein